MKQLSLAEIGFLPKAGKQTRKLVFLSEMETVVPWSRLEALIEPFCPKKGNGRPPMLLCTMLRIRFMQQWFNYSDQAMKEALHDIPRLRQFAGLDSFEDVMPDESTIHRFRHLLEQNELAVAIFTEVNAILGEKGLSMKAHIGVDAKNGLIHTVECTTAKVADNFMLKDCMHGEEAIVYAGRDYHQNNRTIEHFQAEDGLAILAPAKKPKGGELNEEQKQSNRVLSVIRAVVKHPFRVIKQQFGFNKIRYFSSIL